MNAYEQDNIVGTLFLQAQRSAHLLYLDISSVVCTVEGRTLEGIDM
jgi:hypothetical protein